MTKFVYDFTEGNQDLKDLLSGQGANLAEMTNCRSRSPTTREDVAEGGSSPRVRGELRIRFEEGRGDRGQAKRDERPLVGGRSVERAGARWAMRPGTATAASSRPRMVALAIVAPA